MQHIRVLIAHTKVEFGRELAQCLERDLANCAVSAVSIVNHHERWQDVLIERVRTEKAHIVIIDKSLLQNDEDTHQTLRRLMAPASCILLAAGNTVSVASAMHAIYSQVLLASGHHLATTARQVAPMINRDLLRRYAQRQEVSPRRLVMEVADQLNTSLEELQGIFESLFPKAENIVIEPLQQRSAGATPPVLRGRAVLLTVCVDDLVPGVVKIAPRQRIEDEIENYPQIDGRLQDLLYARLERSTLLWNLGAVTYSLIGTGVERVDTFAEFFRYSVDQNSISEVLKAFFDHTWGKLYRDTHKPIRPQVSMFEQYDQVWKGRLSQRLLETVLDQELLSFPGIPSNLPNPLRWLRNNWGAGIIGDARSAITHGDLHGDNLLVDPGRKFCWAIDFERSGRGPILQDFVEMECDIVTRLTEFPNDDLSDLFGMAGALVDARRPDDPLLLPKSGIQSANDFAINKTFGVLSYLRGQRHSSTRYADVREYLWGLLLNSVFLSVSLPEEHPQRTKALLLGSVISARLDTWLQGKGVPQWPPPEWLPLSESKMVVLEPNLKGSDKMDYRRGLEALKEYLIRIDSSLLVDFSTLEARFHRNQKTEQIMGESETTRSEHFRIVDSLNHLAFDYCGVTFTEICKGIKPTK